MQVSKSSARTDYNLEIANEVREGLAQTPKSLPPRLFYDAAGTELFEQITRLPEYYLTRTELGLFQQRAADMVLRASADEPLTLVELGVGSALKTQVLIRTLLEKQQRATYFPVDVSRMALELATATLAPQFPTLEIVPIEGHYREALTTLAGRPGRKLVLFVGSSIGNFPPQAATDLLSELRCALREGDALLLGTDMRKEPSILLPAYDDSQGITALFNKNVLARINRELGGHFDLGRFRHIALWDEESSRVEMHLESTQEQTVRIEALEAEYCFSEGERIHTENSYKFTIPMVDRMLEESGFYREHTWMDRRGFFAEHLARVWQH